MEQKPPYVVNLKDEEEKIKRNLNYVNNINKKIDTMHIKHNLFKKHQLNLLLPAPTVTLPIQRRFH